MIEVQGLGKAYRIYPSPMKRVLEAVSLGKLRGHIEFWALRVIECRLVPGG